MQSVSRAALVLSTSLLAASALLAGCGATQPDPGGAPSPAPDELALATASVIDPIGQWADLSDVEDAAVINFGDFPNNLVVNVDGTLRGNDGCNSFSGTWALDEGVLQFTAMGGTEVACMATSAYDIAFPDFGTIAAAVVDENTLYLLGVDGAVIGTLPRVIVN